MRDIQQVPHHPARGAFRAGAGTSHGEGNIRVAACAEVEYVLGTADGTKRTLYRRVLQANLDRATLRDTHQIAEHVVFLTASRRAANASSCSGRRCMNSS